MRFGRILKWPREVRAIVVTPKEVGEQRLPVPEEIRLDLIGGFKR